MLDYSLAISGCSDRGVLAQQHHTCDRPMLIPSCPLEPRSILAFGDAFDQPPDDNSRRHHRAGYHRPPHLEPCCQTQRSIFTHLEVIEKSWAFSTESLDAFRRLHHGPETIALYPCTRKTPPCLHTVACQPSASIKTNQSYHEPAAAGRSSFTFPPHSMSLTLTRLKQLPLL